MDQPPGSLFAPTRAGHNFDTGAGKLTLTQMPQIQHICLTAGSLPRAGQNCDNGVGKSTLNQMPQIQHVCLAAGVQRIAPLKKTLPTGIGSEASSTGGREGKVGVRNCNQYLRDSPLPLFLLKVTWESPVGIG